MEKDAKNLEAFHREMRKMKEEYMQKLQALNEKYKDDSTPRGRDAGPGTDEYNALVRQADADIHRVRHKYGYE